MNNSLKWREYLLSFCSLFPTKICNRVIMWLFSKSDLDMPTPLQQSWLSRQLTIYIMFGLEQVWTWVSLVFPVIMHRLPFVLCKLWFPTLIPCIALHCIALQWAEVVLFFLFLLQMLLVLLTTYLWLRRRQVFKIFCLHLIFNTLCTICLSSPFAVFQRLANDKFCERNRCIVITVSSNSHPVLSILINVSF